MTQAYRLPAVNAAGQVPVTSSRGQAAPVAQVPAPGSVRFEALGKTYQASGRQVEALRDISLAIEPGQIFGIIGRSGAGKSSLLRTINGLEAPTSGRVLVDGQDVSALDRDSLLALRRRVGMIFQHFNLLSAKTVRQNAALPLQVAGVPRERVEPRVAEVLQMVGLADKADVYPSRLSGGQKQRVGIARALVHQPEILLCDEATSALDPETTLSILQLLKDLNRQLGLTIVLITHEMSVIREICDAVVVLEGGRAVESGPVWRVFSDPQHAATRALLRPLDRDVPEDIATRLSAAAIPGGNAIVELKLDGSAAPDLGSLASLFGNEVRIISASVDRLQNHSHGRLLLAVPAARAGVQTAQSFGVLKVLGYVAADD